MEPDEEERGAVVGFDIVIEFAADTGTLDLRGKQYESRVSAPLLVLGQGRREIQTDDIAKQRRAPTILEIDDKPDDLLEDGFQIVPGLQESTEFFAEVVLVAPDQLEQNVLFGREVKVERASGNSRGFDDGVDVSRAGADSLELDDGRVEYARTRPTTLGFAARRGLSHASIVPHKSDSPTDVTQMWPKRAKRGETGLISLSSVSERATKSSMNTRGQRILLWTAPPAAALLALAYVLFPVFSPPLSPTLSPDEVAAFFRENATGVLGVAILCNLIAGSLIPLFAVTAVQISRVATSSVVLTYAYIICVGVGTTAFILADYCWGMAAFRPDRDPELISLLNDMAWFFFIAPVGTIIVQNLCFALSVYLDERPDPIFPRWSAHFNVATVVLLAPSAFSILVKTGPLAWNGALSFTLRLLTFAVYIVVMFLVLLRAVNRQGSEREVLA